MKLGQALTMQAVAGQIVKSQEFRVAQIRGILMRIAFGSAVGWFPIAQFPGKTGVC
jgi:hypothetical protein